MLAKLERTQRGHKELYPQVELSKNFHRKIAIIFLPINLNMCFGCSKEPSHSDGSSEYPQHMFWLGNKKNNLQLHTLIRGLNYHKTRAPTYTHTQIGATTKNERTQQQQNQHIKADSSRSQRGG